MQKDLGKSSYREDFEFTKEDDETKDLTNQNILLEISSPRTVYSASTYRSVSSSKKEPEFLIASSNLPSNVSKAKTPSNVKGPEKPVLNINLWNDGLNSVEINQSRNEEEHKNLPKKKSSLNRTATSENRLLSSTSLEFRKKNVSICGNDFSLYKEKSTPASLGQDYGRISAQSESNKNLLHFKSITNALDLTNSMNLNPHKSEILKLHQSRLDFKDQLHEINNDFSHEKIRERENKYRTAEIKKENMDLEKEKLKFERDRLALELQQAKMEFAISEGNKEETELALKNEIKFLVNKLVQVKNPGVTASSSHGNLTQLSKGALSKSMMDYQSSYNPLPSEPLNLSQINQPNPSPSFGSTSYDKTMKILSNNLGENKLNESLEKGKVKKMAKVFSEQSVTPLREKCLNSVDLTTLKYSPNRLGEMVKKENSLLMSTMNLNSNHPKKQMQYLKR